MPLRFLHPFDVIARATLKRFLEHSPASSGKGTSCWMEDTDKQEEAPTLFRCGCANTGPHSHNEDGGWYSVNQIARINFGTRTSTVQADCDGSRE